MLYSHDSGIQDDSMFRVMSKESKAKIYEGFTRFTCLFQAVPGLNFTILQWQLQLHFSLAKTYLRIRKLKSCDREHDLPSCNQDILWQLPCNRYFVGWNVFHLPGLRTLIGALSKGKKKLVCQQSQVNILDLLHSMILSPASLYIFILLLPLRD